MKKQNDEIVADAEVIKSAIRLVSQIFEQNNIPQLEGLIALKAILNAHAREGFDLRSEPNFEAML